MAQLIRFLDVDGVARWGVPEGQDSARPLRGEPWGDWRPAESPIPIARLLPPVDPPNIFAIGRNYREHAREMQSQARESEPLIFLKATTSVIAGGEPVVLPASAPNEVDYEAELAVVIGREARNVEPEQALDCILGYTCANDVSARDCQRNDKQWSRAKSFDTFCPVGPGLVTADSLDPASLPIRSMLNGQTMQESNTREMIFPVAQLVSYLSRQFTLRPMTLILTGTPHGVGAARTPPVFLKAGDTISVEIEGIAKINNPVQASPPIR